MSPGKRPVPGDDSDNAGQPSKHQRLDTTNHVDNDLLHSSKRKGSGSTRTGQACLRCRTRKIRCDNRPGGCSPCVQNNTECQTTDRITGRATSRGHTENLENEIVGMKRYVAELQEQLRGAGLRPVSAPAISPVNMQIESKLENTMWTAQHAESAATPRRRSSFERQSVAHALLPGFRAGCVGDNYLGVSSDNRLSPIQGTSLSLFGTKIDLAEFMPSEEEPWMKAMSYQEFLSHAFGKEPRPDPPQLPDPQTCKVYSEWYFRSFQTFIPVLHKPDYMQLLVRMSNASYKPTAAETVMVHMVLAIIFFQSAARNGGEVNRQAFIRHYHYAISFTPDLLGCHEFEDIQALTMICLQLRAQPRPAAAWMFTNMVMGLAIESGLHRSAKAWKDLSLQDPHHLEMRKRVFWVLLRIHVQISGKLGRPMPLRVEDFDIEIPEPMFDNLPEEGDLSDWKKCTFRVGIEGFKLCKIILQIFSTMYTIKSVGHYEQSVQDFEQDLQEFEEQLPPELQGGNQTQMEDRVFAHYLGTEVAQCQLLLHHPALCPSQSHQLLAHILDKCLIWSNKLLSHAVNIASFNSLDTTFFFTADFLAAIFTTLFASHKRRHQMTKERLQQLREDMDQWLNVMKDVGKLLGTGHRLYQAMRSIIDACLGNIGQCRALKSTPVVHEEVEEVEEVVAVDEKHQIRQVQNFHDSHVYSSTLDSDETGGHHVGAPLAQNYHGHPQSQHEQAQHDYRTTPQYPYADTRVNGIPNYGAFDNVVPFAANGPQKSDMEVQMASLQQHQTPIPPDYLTGFQPPPQPSNGVAAPGPPFPHSPAVTHDMNGQPYQHSLPAAWRQFTGSMMDSAIANTMNGHEYMNGTAAALMPQAADESMGVAASHVAAMNGLQLANSASSAQPWPLIQFYTGPTEGS